MSGSILDLVLDSLRQVNFQAEAAYSGRKYPQIHEPVATAHIHKADRDNRTVTVEVHIICPSALGGTFCELEALRAVEALCGRGASCTQDGCEYDGLAKVYLVRILAAFQCVSGPESCAMGPGFRVYILETELPYAVSFHSEWTLDVTPVYEIGETAPIGVQESGSLWKFQLEELVPAGCRETEFPVSVFHFQVENDVTRETYYRCCWTGIRREYTPRGLRLIRTGISMERKEESLG